jgi:XTP/dITP diphosphohydrolase
LLFDKPISIFNQVKNTQKIETDQKMPSFPRLTTTDKLVIASHNAGKFDEFADLFAPFAVQISSALALDLADVIETGTTFEENALLKATQTARQCGMAALGDDSGVMIDALDGAPGIYTARWSETEDGRRDWDLAMRRVADKLREKKATNWSARFVCVLALCFANGQTLVTRGEIKGKLVWPTRGTRGFGYDPMFLPDGQTLTFGEMDPAKKHGMSHRHVAFQKLLAAGVFDAR